MRPRAWFVPLGLLLATIGPQTRYASGEEIVPAGTILNVRTTQPLYADSAQPGMKLSGIVDDPIDVGGRVVIPRGAQATLEVVGVDRSSNLKGRDRITLMVRSLHFRGGVYPVSTNYVQLKGHSEGKRAAKKIAGGAGIGAAIGGLIGGGSGAAFGALAGGGAGAAVAGSGKSHLSVPAETPLQFRLMGSTRID
jgi:hypothetical protein